MDAGEIRGKNPQEKYVDTNLELWYMIYRPVSLLTGEGPQLT